MAKYNWEEIKELEMAKQFEIIEEAMKEKLRKINDVEKIKKYFVDPANNIVSKYNIYKIIDKQEEVIYIGLTSNHKSRIASSHKSGNGHLPLECYGEMSEIHIAPVNNRDEMKIYERYLINLLSPKYNKKMNNNNNFRFKLPKLTWYDYTEYRKLI